MLDPRHGSLHGAISSNATSRPDEISIVEGDSTLSYLRLEERVRGRSAWLGELGVKRGDRVAVLMSNTADHIAIILALSRLGAVHLSLSESDGNDVNGNQLEHYDIGRAISDNPRAVLGGSELIFVAPGVPFGDVHQHRNSYACRPDEPWKIVQTSGSTGSPKAILQTHAMELAYHSRLVPPFSREKSVRFLQAIDLKYSYGLRLCLNVLAAGGTVVLSGRDSSIPNLARIVESHKISHIAATPFHAIGLAMACAAENTVPRSLRYISLAGSIATSHMQSMVRRHLCPNLHVHYGANEVGYLTVADPDLLARFPGTIGLPVPGVEIEVVDELDECVLPTILGRIRARGLDFPGSYVDNLPASAAAFRNGWYYPGDLGSYGRDGELYFRGRADDLINFNGMKIAPVDIEAALHKHPAVKEVVAFALPHPVHQDVPCAAVTTVATASGADLRRFARTMLGRRAPQLVAVLPEIPVRGIGKPDLDQIRSIVLSRLKAGGWKRGGPGF
jgi:acyl-coenzyme A synthetase/AMP-(fatty) acid ligase